MMKFAAFSAALALITFTNAIPTTNNVGLEARRKDKSECDVFKKDLKKLQPAASAYCSSFIASTTTLVVPTTITEVSTAVVTVPVTATSTETTTGPAPTVTKTVFSNCGIPGFGNGANTYFFDGSGALGTFETCQARCRQDAGTCLTFAFGSGQCLLYTADVAAIVVEVPTSPYTFFSVNCPAPASAPAPPVVVKRQAGIPAPLGSYQSAERSAFCSCVVGVPATSTVTVSTTSVIVVTSSLATTATVSTALVTTVVTPAPVTVTATTTA